MNRVTVQPDLLTWARERAGLSVDKVLDYFPKFSEWLSGQAAPTMRQLEDFADKTYTPIGYLFLSEPPEDKLPIPDFRTLGNEAPRRPSPNLLETVHTLQLRQAWMRDYLVEEGEQPLPFVGSLTIKEPPVKAAARMREYLELPEVWAANENTSDDAFRLLRRKIEEAGVFIVINGVVGNNPHRKLSVDEFRGFTLSDEYAPFIFINGTDAKSAQMFTLAHEFTHLWLGQGGVSGLQWEMERRLDDIERYCNETAAEFLLPESVFSMAWETGKNSEEPFKKLANRFKVSPIVVARRAMEMRLVERGHFFSFYNDYMARWRAAEARKKSQGGGGNFWLTQNTRIGDRFGATVVRAARSGRLLYRDAYQLTGLSGSTFDRYADKLALARY